MLSSKFVNKVLERIEKLDIKSLRDFIYTLSQDREFFESIFESMIEGVIVLNENNVIQYINKPAIIILNINDINIIEKNLFDTLSDNHLRIIFEHILRSNQKLKGEEINLRYPINRTIQLSIYPLVKEGKILGNVIVMLDITSQKEEQIKLQRAESLAALTTLAAGVAHEIKNPLGSLDIHIQLLDRLSDQLNIEIRNEFKDLLSVVIEEIDRMNDIVKDFLFTVRPIRIKYEEVDIFELLESVIRLLKYDFEIKNIKIELNGDRKIPKVRVDPRYLKHAFINIVKNSLEACHKNDTVNIAVSKEDENLIIKIADTGRGMKEEHINKVFEPYFTTKDFGTGLGLTIVYKIIKEHKGSIKLDSVEGEGTTIKLIIPCYDKDKRLLSYE
ncbi:MAG: ATP-binding protein [Spirochaetota bacterium]|nr:ATP-binding protein [Spirochaetota bacterium]